MPLLTEPRITFLEMYATFRETVGGGLLGMRYAFVTTT
jgi:hypothetical protein